MCVRMPVVRGDALAYMQEVKSVLDANAYAKFLTALRDRAVGRSAAPHRACAACACARVRGVGVPPWCSPWCLRRSLSLHELQAVVASLLQHEQSLLLRFCDFLPPTVHAPQQQTQQPAAT